MRKERPTWFWALVALVVLFAFNLVTSPTFFAFQVKDGRLFGSIVDIFNRGAIVALLSVGMTLVIATGGIDLSVGAVMAIAGAFAASLISQPDGSWLNAINTNGQVLPIIAVSLLVALACGAFNGFLVSVVGLQPFVATLLLMVAGRGFAQLVTNGQIVIFSHGGFASIGTGATAGIPNPILVMLACFLLALLFTRLTAYGTFLEATGDNPIAALVSGIKVGRVKFFAYVITALCAGIAGLIATADIEAADANNVGLYLELDAILAVCIGGTSLNGGRFTLVGSLIGAIVMQTLTTTILSRGVPQEITLILKALVVIGVCLSQSRSFRGAEAT